MENCIFCKIINQEIPSYKIYEDDKVYAFLDLSQATKGHTLVVPKRHVSDIFDYDQELAGAVFSRVPKIAHGLEKAFPDMKGLNILNNNRELAYQSVFHSHIHLVPRYATTDDFSIHFGNHQADYSASELATIQETIETQVNDID